MKYTIERLETMFDSNGNLDLSGTQITALPENLTVGGGLDLSGTQINYKKIRRLKDGDYIQGKYLYADGVLTHIKNRRKINKYIYFIGKIPGRNVISDGVHYAHCNKFAAGRDDLLFKAAKDRGADQYKNLTLESTMTVEEAKTMYRIITGACQQGTEQFISSFGNKLKDSYSVREMIELTKGQYGAKSFAAFFARKE